MCVGEAAQKLFGLIDEGLVLEAGHHLIERAFLLDLATKILIIRLSVREPPLPDHGHLVVGKVSDQLGDAIVFDGLA